MRFDHYFIQELHEIMLNLSKLEVTEDSIDLDYQKKNVRVKAKKQPVNFKKDTLESSIPGLSQNDSKQMSDSQKEEYESDGEKSNFDEERAEILKELKVPLFSPRTPPAITNERIIFHSRIIHLTSIKFY